MADSRRWVSFFLKRKWLKLLSLLLALAAWMAIQQVINFPVTLSGISLELEVGEGWTLLDSSTDSVEIHLRGAQGDFLRLNPDFLRVRKDLTGREQEGVVTVTLQPGDVQVPGNLRVTAIEPSEVTVSFDREDERRVVVKADLRGTPRAGYAVKRVTCEPASILLRGPRRRLEAIDEIWTVPVDIYDRSDNLRQQVALVMPREDQGVRWERRRVTVEVEIARREVRPSFAELPVQVLTAPGQSPAAGVSPRNVTVTVIGEADALEGLTGDDLRVYVDCTGLEEGARYELPVRLDAPRGVDVDTIEPPSVTVEMRPAPTETDG